MSALGALILRVLASWASMLLVLMFAPVAYKLVMQQRALAKQRTTLLKPPALLARTSAMAPLLLVQPQTLLEVLIKNNVSGTCPSFKVRR